jgi:hypothetical protein
MIEAEQTFLQNRRIPMGRICRVLLLVASSTLAVSSCVTDEYENFQQIMDAQVGQSMDDVPYYSFRAQPSGTKTLPNGNLEYRYVRKRFRGICKYILEVDNKTHKVVAWRYDGADKDKACFVNP